MKKLCIITDTYPFGRGEYTFVAPELEQLRRAFDVTLVSCGTGEQTYRLPENVRLLHYTHSTAGRIAGWPGALADPLFRRELKEARSVNGLSAVKRCMIHLADARHFGRWLKKNLGEADIIYSFWHTAPLLGALRVRKALGDPAVVTRAHGFDLYHYRLPEKYQPYKRYCDDLLDRVYLISEQGRDYYLENYSAGNASKCLVRYLGADNDRLSPCSESPVLRLCSCAYMKPIKRLHLIIEALALLDIPTEWVHFGGGEQEAELTALAEEKLAPKGNCKYTFTGSVPNEYVGEYMAEHPFDCFVSASQTEGLPVSIMEAFSFGIPAVATDAGGTRELVNEKTGILLPVELSARELANALLKIKSLSPEETQALRKGAYDRWKEDFVASENARRFCAELLELCEKR